MAIGAENAKAFAKAPCKATNVQRPPILNHTEKFPCASGPHKRSKECPILLAGVETAAVKKLQPSKKELAKPWVYQEVTNVIPVNHPPRAKYAHGNNNKPDHPTNTNLSFFSQSSTKEKRSAGFDLPICLKKSLILAQDERWRGKGNFQWSGEMRRDWKEHQKRRHFTGPLLTLRDES
ncbi:hypothetical protein Lal_00048606 [Lupinus albus]|nr:hypothetical protein Lal_00048606 [Lupinus albus]